jgi:hypothetical protein
MEANERTNALRFAKRVYEKLAGNRAYALTPDAKVILSTLGKAVLLRQAGPDDAERAQLMQRVIEKLNGRECNILQQRPDAPKPVPEPWKDPFGNILPNSFLTKDLKAQSLLMQRDPELAALYERLAKDQYGTVAQLADDEVQRAALSAIEYGETQHAANPFRRDNQSEQAAFTKRDKMLADFYREEAKPVDLPLFGAMRNITLRGRLSRDADVGAVIETAEKIHTQWRAEDKAAAEAQAKEAQTRLAELQKEIEGEGKSQLRIA